MKCVLIKTIGLEFIFDHCIPTALLKQFLNGMLVFITHNGGGAYQKVKVKLRSALNINQKILSGFLCDVFNTKQVLSIYCALGLILADGTFKEGKHKGLILWRSCRRDIRCMNK